VEQIRAEQQRQELSVQQLLDKSQLPIDRSTLHRKLKGDVPTTDAECEALAEALRAKAPTFTLVWPKRSRGRR
jgi:hypothetical protein